MNRLYRSTWTMPVVLNVLTIAGLLIALLLSDEWRWLSWLCLSVALFIGVERLFDRRKPR